MYLSIFFNYLSLNKIITKFQSGFLPGDSTTNQLLRFTDDIGKALDLGKEIMVIFCDISRAFDRVWHEGLLYKLEKIGIHGNLLRWFRSYLSDRKQRVVIGGHKSDILTIKAGVPQGSILGPLLFLVFINDIVDEIACNIRLFADDTSLYIVVEDEYATSAILNSDVDIIHAWSQQWLVTFNPKKTQCMTISKKVIKPHHPPIYMNNVIIQEVEEHEHLGLIFQEDGNWTGHIDYIISKATPRLNLLRTLKFKLSRSQLQTIYFSFIRPILEYGDVIWDNIPNYLKDKLENVQLEAARVVTGANKLCSIVKLYNDTGWDSLSERRRKHKIIKFHEMVHSQTLEYISELVPQQLNQLHNYNTRRNNNIQTINCRTSYYKNSFLPSSVNEWNSLPDDIKSSSKYVLKQYLKNNRTVPKYYNYGNRRRQVLHARLRLNCSSLNEHLFNKNLVASNRCTCGQVETVKHYFFDCNIYQNIRTRTINTLPRVNTNILLHGNTQLSTEENEHIFEIVQTFIADSGRFGF